MATPKRERVALVVEAADDDIPPMSIRLRHLLKLALRRCGLRVLWHQAADDWRFGDEIEQAVQPVQGSAGGANDRSGGSESVGAAIVDPGAS